MGLGAAKSATAAQPGDDVALEIAGVAFKATIQAHIEFIGLARPATLRAWPDIAVSPFGEGVFGGDLVDQGFNHLFSARKRVNLKTAWTAWYCMAFCMGVSIYFYYIYICIHAIMQYMYICARKYKYGVFFLFHTRTRAKTA